MPIRPLCQNPRLSFGHMTQGPDRLFERLSPSEPRLLAAKTGANMQQRILQPTGVHRAFPDAL